MDAATSSAAQQQQQPAPSFLRLPRELRDAIYALAAAPRTSLVLVQPGVFAHVVFVGVPELALLRVCAQVRGEALQAVARRAECSLLDAWDCQGAYDPRRRRNAVPAAVLERVHRADMLCTWAPVDHIVVCVDALLNYVTGVRELQCLFNDSNGRRDTIRQLQQCRVTHSWNPVTYKHDARFRKRLSGDTSGNSILSKDPVKVVCKTYVRAANRHGLFVPGHYAECHEAAERKDAGQEAKAPDVLKHTSPACTATLVIKEVC